MRVTGRVCWATALLLLAGCGSPAGNPVPVVSTGEGVRDAAPAVDAPDVPAGPDAAGDVPVDLPQDVGADLPADVPADPGDLPAEVPADVLPDVPGDVPIDGDAGPCTLAVDPAAGLEFGTVRVGCADTRQATLSNPCGAAVVLGAVAPVDEDACTAVFAATGLPALPVTLDPGQSLALPVRFAPVADGDVACTLRVAAPGGAALLDVPVAGTGKASAREDAFTQVAGDLADVLLVIDGSGSMAPALALFAQELGGLRDAMVAAGIDFQVGVAGIGADAACPTSASLLGTPRLRTAATWDGLDQVVLGLGTDPCGSSAQEAGLEVARLALSDPLATDLGTACAAPADCPPPYGCVEGGCGGANRGLLRPDAALHVVVLSDEDDQSPLSTEVYTDFLEGLKGPGNEALVFLHAIVGEPPAGCDGSAGSGVTAEAGKRYAKVAEATGGQVQSVCAASYAPLLASIGALPRAYRAAFPLSSPAEPSSIAVTVAGVPCTDGWKYVAKDNAVVFDPAGACFPGPSAAIVVRYTPPCG